MSEEKQKKPFYKRTWFIVLVALFILSSIGRNGRENRSQSSDLPSQSSTSTSTVAQPKDIPTSEPEPVEEFPDATMGEKNALETAKRYLSHSNFSHDGLVGQLEYEGYSLSEATFAVDNCGADWNEQAAGKALGYLSYSNFSYNGLIEQLEYEEFTHEQAVYGADSCGADWNEQAAGKAASYLQHSSFSRERLIEQLEYEGFTYEQAVYGVEQNGY